MLTRLFNCGNARNQVVWFVREALMYNVVLSKFLLISLSYSWFVSAFAATGSDIGGDEIIAGNVNKYTVLPAGYSGQPKKGHLVFDACFESGKHFSVLLCCWTVNIVTHTSLIFIKSVFVLKIGIELCFTQWFASEFDIESDCPNVRKDVKFITYNMYFIGSFSLTKCRYLNGFSSSVLCIIIQVVYVDN